jgi:hypothetical protein
MEDGCPLASQSWSTQTIPSPDREVEAQLRGQQGQVAVDGVVADHVGEDAAQPLVVGRRGLDAAAVPEPGQCLQRELPAQGRPLAVDTAVGLDEARRVGPQVVPEQGQVAVA